MFLLQSENVGGASTKAWLNTGRGWASASAWKSPTPFTQAGNNIGRRLGDVDGDWFADILVGYSNATAGVNNGTWLKNASTPSLLKSVTHDFGAVTSVVYDRSTRFINSGNDSVSDLGFNVWVVANVTRNNSLTGALSPIGRTSTAYDVHGLIRAKVFIVIL